ncbi:isatin hydrolase isoform X1 [Dermacentor silvarum]|uniref:isatin hydrolase isoform X1 n=2 Tax=Dermacentor silvarum TaxID=543639 RepID=UPI0021010434|nr:isatin hydrolase isoform X1 [Dermacentor silvarum]
MPSVRQTLQAVTHRKQKECRLLVGVLPRHRWLRTNVSAACPLLVLAACALSVRQAACQPSRSMGPKLVDLSYVFDKNTVYPSPSANFSLDVRYRKTKHGVRYQEENLCSSTQGGTHVIAPRHLLKGRWSVTDLPLNRLVVPGAVIDISIQVLRSRDYRLRITDVMRWEDIHGRLPQGCVLFVRTGWSRYWPSWYKYHGHPAAAGNGTSSYLPFDTRPHHPGVHPDTATWLVSKRKVYGVGIDAPSLDYGLSKDLGAQHILLAANIYGLVNVANLQELPSVGSTLFVFPMKIRGAGAAPVRILAVVP